MGPQGEEREQGVPWERALALPTPVGFALQGQAPENKCGLREKSCLGSAARAAWTETELPGEGGHSGADRRPVDTEKAKAQRAPPNSTPVFCQSCAVPCTAE